MNGYADYVRRGQSRWGDRYREPEAASVFGPYFHGPRVRVRFASGEEMTGTVSGTTGWHPSFLLMHRSSDIGSPWRLGADDRIVAVQRGRRYEVIP
jgi:hypothetical protein